MQLVIKIKIKKKRKRSVFIKYDVAAQGYTWLQFDATGD